MKLAVAPVVAQLVGGNHHRRQRRARLGLQKAEALGQFAGNQSAQRHVVEKGDELDVVGTLFGIGPHGDIIGNDSDFSFKVNAPIGIFDFDGVERRQKAVGYALVHQGGGEEAVRNLGAARLEDALNVGQVGRAVEKLVTARQGSGQGAHVQLKAVGGPVGLQIVIQAVQPGRRVAPVV